MHELTREDLGTLGTCECGEPGRACLNPWDLEVHNKENIQFLCPDCYDIYERDV